MIPGGDTFLYQCELTIHRRGSFEVGMDLFVADPNIRTVTVKVRGVGIPSRESRNDKPSY